MSHNFIDLDQYSISYRIGEGPISEFFLLISKNAETTHAIKILNKFIHIHSNLKTENIIIDDKKVYIA